MSAHDDFEWGTAYDLLDEIDRLRDLLDQCETEHVVRDETGQPIAIGDLVALWEAVHHADWVSYEHDRGIRALINRLSKVRAVR